ncbi:uncharacterized protein BX663DRAFT_507393 [Cokeromyces recurvatus]|uniref:uncharacterized protein n=1 Tax=Cokeromyces recurvatus TaxID=90255 RepID=UPI00221EB815|nr:uncharacterized protein BX663DRAFT_507393 [Cokeromyces recurvatus]KAI7903729.1 hypothetical protein BX663DRAFT_507393 [Cokeromyces recurvatus]
MQEHSLTDYPNSDGLDIPTQQQQQQARTSHFNTNTNTSITNNNTEFIHHQQPKQYPSLGVKLSRSSNVVSFSKTHPHLLAAGLDKVRNDPCLLVWDVTRSIDSYCNTPTGPQTPNAQVAFPVVRGFTQQESRASITNQWRIDNGRNNNHTDSYEDRARYNDIPPISSPNSGSREQGPIRQYGSSEAISSCAWSEHENAPLLIAGMGNKYVRVYDIRADLGSYPLQFATKAIHGIAIDPFCPYRFGSYTEEGIIKLWDIRKNNEAVLTLSPENKNNLSKIVFSRTQPGFLASLTKDESHIDLWDIQETSSLQAALNSSVQRPTTTIHSNTTPLSMNASTNMNKLERGLSQSVLQTLSDDETLSIPVLWKSRKTKSSMKRFASFVFIPPSHSSSSLPNTHHILTIHTDGKFESIKVQETCQIAWQPKGGMMMTGKIGSLYYHPASPEDKIIENIHLDNDNPLSEISKQESIITSKDKSLVKELNNDISVVMRKRLSEGYSMDPSKNLLIIKEDRKLRELWTWIKIADNVASKLSKIGSMDYSFHGVYGIWMSSQAHRNHSSSSASSRLDSTRQISHNRKEVENLETTNDSFLLPMVETNKLLQRNLALTTCGFTLDIREFEQELVDLESKGEYDKAAGLALFHGIPERAISALSNAKGKDPKEEQQHKLMSAILASYQAKGIEENNTWKEICESLSNDMIDRPYLQTIFAFIASNDWYRVLNEHSLPLRERMAVALRVLNDEELSTYLNRILDELVQEGDVEGVVVTGLTPKGIDLFEKSLDRYGDVQTVSLVMSYVVPKRFKDGRVEDWVENYRQLMDRWQMWHERAKFDIQRGQKMNASEIAPPQIYVRCNFCAQSLGHSLVIQNARNREGKRMNVQTSNPGGRASGKQKNSVCLSCRKPLPRCALCLLHMGTPIDQLRQTIMMNDTHKVDPAGFDLWFTWCQTCRHGGHAIHMFEWFQKHSICPVSNCTCQCQL